MKTRLGTRLRYIAHWIILLTLITACSGSAAPSPAASTRTAENLSGLSAESIATLQSLEKVDDYPLYVMHYSGEYQFPQTGWIWPAEHDFACSLFAALSPKGEMLYGRNFDWDFSPALLLFTNPPDGYASVSMVDLTFLGISAKEAKSLEDLPLSERTALLSAPAMPFDGMNEYGLTVAMAAVPDTGTRDAGKVPSKPTIGSIGIIREVLDHARSTEEAIERFQQYNIDFTGGPPIHYLIADPSGNAALIEIYQGEMVVLPNEDPWHMATNHLRCTATGDGGCSRYRALSEQLSAANGLLDQKAAFELLSEVAQGNTQWSAVYNMTSGDVSVVIGKSYGEAHNFHLDLEKP